LAFPVYTAPANREFRSSGAPETGPLKGTAGAADTSAMGTRKTDVDLIVRRGALRRFHKLKQKAAELPVNVAWDRRQQDRRAESSEVRGDRRTTDRRAKPPFTWEASDFVVVRMNRARA